MGRQVVGVFVASREACGGDEIVRIRSEFEVEDFVSFDRHRPRNQALLTALVLNPIFSGHCRFALKEVGCVFVCSQYFLFIRHLISCEMRETNKNVETHFCFVCKAACDSKGSDMGVFAFIYTAAQYRRCIPHLPIGLPKEACLGCFCYEKSLLSGCSELDSMAFAYLRRVMPWL